MKTLNDEWRNFHDMTYPAGTTPEQNRQLHQTFIAGATAALAMVLEEVSALPDDEAEKALAALIKEGSSFCRTAADAGLVRQAPKG